MYYLSSRLKMPAFLMGQISESVKLGQTSSEKRKSTDTGNKSNSTAASSGTVVDSLSGSLTGSFLKDIDEIEVKAYNLIARTPNGSQLAEVVKRLRRREDKYIHWKLDGCPSIEMKPSESLLKILSFVDPTNSAFTISWQKSADDGSYKIPRNLSGKEDSFRTFIQENKRDFCFSIHGTGSDASTGISEEVKDYARMIVERIPTFDDYIQVTVPLVTIKL